MSKNEQTYILYQELHNDQWTWISKNPKTRCKTLWFNFNTAKLKFHFISPDKLCNQCFACSASKLISETETEHTLCCPILWPKKPYCMASIYGTYKATFARYIWTLDSQYDVSQQKMRIFLQQENDKYLEQLKKLAIQIANLPWHSYDEYTNMYNFT